MTVAQSDAPCGEIRRCQGSDEPPCQLAQGEMTRSMVWLGSDALPAAAALLRSLHHANREPSLPGVTTILEHLVRWANGDEATMSRGDAEALKFDVTTTLAKMPLHVLSFITWTSTTAEAARDDEQLLVCWRRSAIQLLLDHHAAVFDALEPIQREKAIDVIDSIDFELRRMGTDYGRLPEDDLPRGLPSSHWWWWPEPKPGYKRWLGWDEPR